MNRPRGYSPVPYLIGVLPLLVRVVGFEPTTSRFQAEDSSGLSYTLVDAINSLARRVSTVAIRVVPFSGTNMNSDACKSSCAGKLLPLTPRLDSDHCPPSKWVCTGTTGS